MNSVKEIEEAIGNLTPEEYEELSQWLEDFVPPEPIDLQLKEDLEAGRIDERIRRAVADHAAGKTRPL